jgi:phosphoglycolate phosphatase
VRPLAILFDIDGTLISTGGAGGVAWRRAFEELHGIPADIGQFTDAGMTDPVVGFKTFTAVIGRDPTPRELTRLLAARQKHLPETVSESTGYRVLDGVEELLPRLADDGYLLGLTTGGTDAAAHIKLARGNLGRWFPVGGYGSDSTDRTELTRIAIQRCGRMLGMDLDPHRVLVIGDTPLDIEAAQGAHAIGVGVASGHFTEEELDRAGADHVLPSLRTPLPGVPTTAAA